MAKKAHTTLRQQGGLDIEALSAGTGCTQDWQMLLILTIEPSNVTLLVRMNAFVRTMECHVVVTSGFGFLALLESIRVVSGRLNGVLKHTLLP